jgi:hypothetical protein
MTSNNSDGVNLTARCLCKSSIFTTFMPYSQLPLRVSTCHCYSCRHVSGHFYNSGLTSPEPHDNVDVSALKIYPYLSTLSILFCPTCSTPVFIAKEEGRVLHVSTSVLSN